MNSFIGTILCFVIYCFIVAFTYGYVLERNNCYPLDPTSFSDECSAEPFFKATIWPIYWIYHSGTLLFEPTNMDR